MGRDRGGRVEEGEVGEADGAGEWTGKWDRGQGNILFVEINNANSKFEKVYYSLSFQLGNNS